MPSKSMNLNHKSRQSKQAKFQTINNNDIITTKNMNFKGDRISKTLERAPQIKILRHKKEKLDMSKLS